MARLLMAAKDSHTEPSLSNGFEKPPRLWGWYTILSGMGTIALLTGLATFIDWQNIRQELLACQKGYILLGAGFHYLTYPLLFLPPGPSSTQLPNSVLWALVGGGIIALGATTIMLLFFFLDRALPGWVPEKIKEMIQAFRKGMWPRKGEIPLTLISIDPPMLIKMNPLN